MSKLTTVSVYESDLRELDETMIKGEFYRDKIHQLIMDDKKMRDDDVS